MNGEEMRRSWNGLSEEIISGIAEWRQQHPKATFREIETEVDKRLAVLRARMLSDAALRSAQAEWDRADRQVVCPNCGARLEQKGKKKRKLQTCGEQGGSELRGEDDPLLAPIPTYAPGVVPGGVIQATAVQPALPEAPASNRDFVLFSVFVLAVGLLTALGLRVIRKR